MRAEHLLAGEVFRHHGRLAPIARYRCTRSRSARPRRLRERRRDLRQARQVGAAQHQADIGMRDQPAFVADDIGIPAAPDLQVVDDVPDQLQIDFGDRDPGVAALMGDRHRDIGLGLLAEIDRAEPQAIGLGPEKGRALRKIFRAADRVHRQPRHLELLLPRGIELPHLGDRRHLTQQPEIILAALVERRGGPLRMRRPADLALDLVDKPLDALGRRERLLLLQADQRGLGFLVGEPEIETARDQQRGADQPDQQQRVFAEQPAARRRHRGRVGSCRGHAGQWRHYAFRAAHRDCLAPKPAGAPGM